MSFFSNVTKLFRSTHPAPQWFKLEAYAGSASFGLRDWLEQLFIRYQVRRRLEGSMCILSTDPTFDYIQKIGLGIIDINPQHACRANDAPARPGQFVSISALQGAAPFIQLPDDMATVMQEWNDNKLLPFMDVVLWQRIKGYVISTDALMQLLEMDESMLSGTMPRMMEQVLSTDYLRALNHHAISHGGHGLPQGCLDA